MQQIIIQTLDYQGKFISDEELKVLRDYWPEFHKMRLVIELMAYIGLRAKDVENLKCPGHSQFEGFAPDFKSFKYLVSKPKNKNNRIHYKVKERVVPSWLAHKLHLYFKNNLYTFKGNRLIQLQARTMRDLFCQARKRITEQHPSFKEIHQNIIHPNGRVEVRYRICLHTLRAYWITNCAEELNYNIAKTAKIIGHTNERTTFGYVRFPKLKQEEKQIAENRFNLPGQPKLYVSKNQAKLNDYGINTLEHQNTTRHIQNGNFWLVRCTTCNKAFNAKSKNKKYCSKECKQRS